MYKNILQLKAILEAIDEQRKSIIVTLKGLSDMLLREVLEVLPSFHLFIKKVYLKINL